ncbi:hypothetical protein PV328_011865, partial [Microctonus aethiopoides]
MGRGKTKYALIWWVNTSHKDIVKLSVIPKKFQFIDGITPLVWQNYKTETKTTTDAKILAIDTDVNALNEMLITNKGTVHEPSNKILLPEMNTKKKALAEQSKFVKNVQKHNCKHIEERIKTENSIISLLHTKHPQTSRSNEFKSSIPQDNNNLNEYDSCQKSSYETSHFHQLNYATKIFPNNLEIPDQRHINQDSHNECSRTGITESLDEEYETDIDENESDTSNVACVKKSVQASARVLSGIIPIPPEFLRPSDNMVEISPGCGFYLRKCKFSIIQLNYERDEDWRQMVRE